MKPWRTEHFTPRPSVMSYAVLPDGIPPCPCDRLASAGLRPPPLETLSLSWKAPFETHFVSLSHVIVRLPWMCSRVFLKTRPSALRRCGKWLLLLLVRCDARVFSCFKTLTGLHRLSVSCLCPINIPSPWRGVILINPRVNTHTRTKKTDKLTTQSMQPWKTSTKSCNTRKLV